MRDDAGQAKALKVQATVSGYTAWALREFTRRTQQLPAEVVKIALDDWVLRGADYLGKLGITHERFYAEVVEGVAEVVKLRLDATNDRSDSS
jgi:hypothetical protein